MKLDNDYNHLKKYVKYKLKYNKLSKLIKEKDKLTAVGGAGSLIQNLLSNISLSCESCCEFEVEHINTTQEKITIKIIDGTPEMIIDKQQTTHITKKFTLVKNAQITNGSSMVPDLCNMFIDAFLYVNEKGQCDTKATGRNTKYDIELDLGVERVYAYTEESISQLGGKFENRILHLGNKKTPLVRPDKLNVHPNTTPLVKITRAGIQSLPNHANITVKKKPIENFIQHIYDDETFIGVSNKGLGFLVKTKNVELINIITECFRAKLTKIL